MRAMLLDSPGTPLRLREIARPAPGPGQVLLRVEACAVCRTDLHIADGELPRPRLPLVPGHQIVGIVVQPASRIPAGTRVGIPWLGSTCGTCRFCAGGRENLCEEAKFTGYDLDGGFAEYAAADERFAFELPRQDDPAHLAPLLCGALIGYRAWRMVPEAETVGIYGFGSAAHMLTQIAVAEGRRLFAFTREGDERGQQFARGLGASWAGSSSADPPEPLDAALIFAPAGELVPRALRAVRKGGSVVCAGIHMSEIPSFPYELLWGERVLRSVANLTRDDARALFHRLRSVRVRTRITEFPLDRANDALEAIRHGSLEGSAVVVP